MEGGMQRRPLLVTSILEYAGKVYANQEVISRNPEGGTSISTYAEVHKRAQGCSLALMRLGVRAGDRVATLAWNTVRHLEAWYGIMGMGAVCHTLNPRLFVKDLEYIINHAEDIVLMFDIQFAKLIAQLQPLCPSVKAYIVMTDRGHMPAEADSSWKCYDDIVAAEMPNLPFTPHILDENTACGLCYTSGTTGRPKKPQGTGRAVLVLENIVPNPGVWAQGVLYSHRSNYLHVLSVVLVDVTGLQTSDTVLMVVPMFHANSWGLAFAAPMVGARLVLPGPQLDGASMYNMLEEFQVTNCAAVPTVWMGLLQHMDKNGLRLSTLQKTIIGGAACPPSLIAAFEDRYGVEIRHAWGMTETSPVGTMPAIKGTLRHLPIAEKRKLQAKQGRPLPLVEMKIVDDEGRQLPWDGKSFGSLLVRGPFVVERYFKHEKPAVDEEGWFDTGDVATIDSEGHMQITDRSKDVIKSGGEWISSIDVENAAQGHPKSWQVVEAAVIGVPHEKWTERPLLVVVPSPGDQPTVDELKGFLKGKIASWWIPDDVVFVKELPHNATGKVHKLVLRDQMKDYKLRSPKL